MHSQNGDGGANRLERSKIEGAPSFTYLQVSGSLIMKFEERPQDFAKKEGVKMKLSTMWSVSLSWACGQFVVPGQR